MEEKHIPGRLQISTECNHDCLFCSVPKFPIEKPSFKELKKRIKKMKELGTNDLYITGGEPTIHKDFFDILDYAENIGFKEITIQSNGSNLSKSFLERVKRYHNVKFDVSFHSSKEECFSKLSNSTNYESLLSGLENLRDMNISVFLTIVINKLNYKKLKQHIEFIRAHFPNITHFSFNFVDPVGRARDNRNIVPTLAETERYICEAVEYLLANGLTFRLERVPLCYMSGFEEFSTEVRMPAFDEKRLTYFAQNEDPERESLNVEEKSQYHKTEACNYCFLKHLCPGLNPNYIAIHGSDEVFPVFTKPEEIINRIRSSKVNLSVPDGRNALNSFESKVYDDLALFKKAIKEKPNKNNIYDTYSYFLMNNVGFRDKLFVHRAWEAFMDKVRRGLEPDLLSLYIHFPYCQSSCSYCIYPSTKLLDKQQIEDYLDYLINEMKGFSPLFKDVKFKTLSIGGGTPSLMSESQLRKLVSEIFGQFKFEDDGEKSIEFNPNTTTAAKLKILKEFGFNKLSIGVQSLSPRVLQLNNRGYQTVEKVSETISCFKKLDTGYINVDLLLGLRGDTPEDFLESFEGVCKMKPGLISIYPVKTNDDYINSVYGDVADFLDFYYPLFDNVTKKLPFIARKYGFTSYEDPSKLSYVHPFDFHLKDEPARNIKYTYANFKTEPYSTLGLGYYSESCINNMMRYIYVDKSNPSTMFLKKFSTKADDFAYSTILFAPHYAKVKFITHSVYENFAILKEEYKKMFGTEITNDFPYAIKALEHLNIITSSEKEISFNVADEKETYEYLLFFVGRDYVKKRISAH